MLAHVRVGELRDGLERDRGIVELVAFIEGKYDIKLDSDDLVVANFSLIASIVALITEKKRG